MLFYVSFYYSYEIKTFKLFSLKTSASVSKGTETVWEPMKIRIQGMNGKADI